MSTMVYTSKHYRRAPRPSGINQVEGLHHSSLVITMRVLLLFLLIPFFTPGSYGQSQGDASLKEIDSLYTLLINDQLDTLPLDDQLIICQRYSSIQSEKANAFCERVISSAFAIENQGIIASAYLQLGTNLNKQGEPAEGFNNLKEGLEISKKADSQKVMCDAYAKLGVYYHDRGDNVQAVAHHIRSLRIATQLSDSLGIIRAHVNLTSVYLDQSRPEKGIEYGLKGLAYARAFSGRRLEGYLLNNLAVAYTTQNNPLEANKYLLEALEINQKNDDMGRVSRNYSNLCNTYRMLGDLSIAKVYCQKAQDVLSSHNNPRSEMLHAIQYGNYYLAINDLKNATIQAEKALSLSKSANLDFNSAGAYELLHSVYKRSGLFEQALSAYETQVAIKYGSENTVRNMEIAKIENDYLDLLDEKERIQNKAAIALVEKESLLSASQRNYALGLSGLLGLLGFTFYNRARLKQKNNDILKIKNTEIEKQSTLIKEALSEKELLLKEIHHRVKNNLQIISSLLNLQSKKVTDESVLASINEGKNRVEAMSLIHQNLYQSDQLAEIDMQDYFEELMGHLSRSFDVPGKQVKYEVRSQGIAFDIDTAIPVGLMVNELVSNAYKHGFAEKKEGLISIVITTAGEDTYQLKVADNGIGMPNDKNTNSSASLGLRLVKTLSTKQLKGKLAFNNTDGCQAIITFKDLKKAI